MLKFKSIKSLLFAAVAAVVMAVGLTACGGAQAAALPKIFTDSANTVIDINHARYFFQTSGGVSVLPASSTTAISLSDPSGVLYSKLINSAPVAATWVNIPSTTTWVNLDEASKITCNTGTNNITFAWSVSGISASSFSDSGCTLFNQIISNGN
jgi:hypothetical protein